MGKKLSEVCGSFLRFCVFTDETVSHGLNERASEGQELTMKLISIEQASSELDLILDNYHWYVGNEIETNGRKIVVFVETMTKDVSDIVPDRLYGYQITMAYEAYKDCGKKYGVILRDHPVRFDEEPLISS